jgi:hypothetical protein
VSGAASSSPFTLAAVGPALARAGSVFQPLDRGFERVKTPGLTSVLQRVHPKSPEDLAGER